MNKEFSYNTYDETLPVNISSKTHLIQILFRDRLMSILSGSVYSRTEPYFMLFNKKTKLLCTSINYLEREKNFICASSCKKARYLYLNMKHNLQTTAFFMKDELMTIKDYRIEDDSYLFL